MIVVTGSELVRGERTDLNGPFLARSLLALGLEPARIEIVGDDPAELEAAVRDAVASADLVACSGGLGPTHDDRTVEVVAKVAGRPLQVDEELEAQIEGVSRMAAERMKRPYADFAQGVTKQATVPEGADVPRARRDRARSRRRGGAGRRSSCFRGRRPSCSGSGRGRSRRRRSDACSTAASRRSGAR